MSDSSANLSKLDANQVLRLSYDDQNNRLRVGAEVTASIADVEVAIDAAGGDNIAIADKTGTNYLEPNPDGSINVVLNSSGLTTKNIFAEIEDIASGITSIIVQYTAIANTKLLKVDVGGTNIAAYSIYIGGELQAKKYTFYQTLNETMDFKDGLPVEEGDVISVEVIHDRPSLGNFNAGMLIQN